MTPVRLLQLLDTLGQCLRRPAGDVGPRQQRCAATTAVETDRSTPSVPLLVYNTTLSTGVCGRRTQQVCSAAQPVSGPVVIPERRRVRSRPRFRRGTLRSTAARRVSHLLVMF